MEAANLFRFFSLFSLKESPKSFPEINPYNSLGSSYKPPFHRYCHTLIGPNLYAFFRTQISLLSRSIPIIQAQEEPITCS
jgi:hypothetical protein